MKRTGIDLFAGIGGFSLAMRRCGIRVTAQVEIDEYCQKVLEKNFPGVKRLRDVRLAAHDLRRHRPWIICGGFPCQDISSAGKGAGIEGDRSNLWWAMWAIISTLRPDWVLVENVPALRTRGSDNVLASLEALGYSCWPLVVGALHVGAPHQRQRVWIVAHADRLGIREQPGRRSGVQGQEAPEPRDGGEAVGDTNGRRFRECNTPPSGRDTGNGVVDTKHQGHERRSGKSASKSTRRCTTYPGERQYGWEQPRAIPIESGLGRTIDGIPGRVDKHRIKALGNAIVPQVAEQILRAIIAVEDNASDNKTLREE